MHQRQQREGGCQEYGVDPDGSPYLVDESRGDRNAPAPSDSNEYRARIDGLSSSEIQATTVVSEDNANDSFDEQLASADGGCQAAESQVLYMSPNQDDELSGSQRAALTGKEQLNGVHGAAKWTFRTRWGDALSRDIKVTPIATKEDFQKFALTRAGIDPAQWDPSQGYGDRIIINKPGQSAIVQKVYDYYQSLYKLNGNFQWAAMARMASRSVVQGLIEIQQARLDIAMAYLVARVEHMPVAELEGWARLGATVSFDVETTLLQMQKDIFTDLAWQHEAYLAGGIDEMKIMLDAGVIDQATYDAWKNIDDGITQGNQSLVWLGNVGLLKREQQTVLASSYAYLASIPGVAQQMSQTMPNPMPGGAPFNGSDVTDFNQRWPWITSQMVGPWQAMTQTQRDQWMGQTFRVITLGKR